MKIDRSRPTPASFWTYKAPPAPDHPPPGVSATRQECLQLTSGYRREIARQLERVVTRRDNPSLREKQQPPSVCARDVVSISRVTIVAAMLRKPQQTLGFHD